MILATFLSANAYFTKYIVYPLVLATFLSANAYFAKYKVIPKWF